jgi:HAD superfamily hydrolase (TIGR01458 family)
VAAAEARIVTLSWGVLERAADGCLIDLDGTLWVDECLLEGAAGAVARIRGAGLPLRFLTNTTRKSRRVLAEQLSRQGIEATTEDVVTATAAAAAWLREQGVERILPLVAEPALEDLDGFAIDRDRPEVVLIADLGTSWSFEVLDGAFRAGVAGADLVAVQKNRYWQTGGNLSLDAGPFVAALEYATGKIARVVGKPSRELFETAARELGLEPAQVVMVGDDLAADVEGARAAGLRGIAVRTGKYRPEDEERAQGAADAVLDSIADLPKWLGVSPV